MKKQEELKPVFSKDFKIFRSELGHEFSAHKLEVRAQFKGIAAQFKQVDVRFRKIDARFNEVDARFNEVDARFDEVDTRFKEVDARFDRLEARVDRLEAKVDRALLLHEENSRDIKLILEYLKAIALRLDKHERQIANINDHLGLVNNN